MTTSISSKFAGKATTIVDANTNEYKIMISALERILLGSVFLQRRIWLHVVMVCCCWVLEHRICCSERNSCFSVSRLWAPACSHRAEEGPWPAWPDGKGSPTMTEIFQVTV